MTLASKIRTRAPFPAAVVDALLDVVSAATSASAGPSCGDATVAVVNPASVTTSVTTPSRSARLRLCRARLSERFLAPTLNHPPGLASFDNATDLDSLQYVQAISEPPSRYLRGSLSFVPGGIEYGGVSLFRRAISCQREPLPSFFAAIP